jgi:hypothetical protein
MPLWRMRHSQSDSLTPKCNAICASVLALTISSAPALGTKSAASIQFAEELVRFPLFAAMKFPRPGV